MWVSTNNSFYVPRILRECIVVIANPRRHIHNLVFIEWRPCRTLKEIDFEVFLEHLRLKRLYAAHLQSLQPTGDDTIKEREVIGHIHRNSMHSDPSCHMNPNRGNLISIHIHSSFARNSLTLDVEFIQRIYNCLLKLCSYGCRTLLLSASRHASPWHSNWGLKWGRQPAGQEHGA